MMKRTVVSLCLLFSAGAAHAENWVQQIDRPHRVYIDFDSIRHEDGLTSFLEKETFPNRVNTRLPPTYQQQVFFSQAVSQQIVNCKRLTVIRTETTLLDESGEVVARQRFDGASWGRVKEPWLYGALKNLCPSR
ncbi:hypothetical protein [Paraburkholderia youngii]|uniref:hypothetical protein n=1 Tax=Paraburkholderia youngii TaxID=2782701 RepID=UPI003D1C9FFA